jgi:hypothetical protein
MTNCKEHPFFSYALMLAFLASHWTLHSHIVFTRLFAALLLRV